MALGPFPSDGFFGSANYSKFDAILAMYHDQGLTPFKALAFETGVNLQQDCPWYVHHRLMEQLLKLSGKTSLHLILSERLFTWHVIYLTTKSS
jgi:hypothetical protein